MLIYRVMFAVNQNESMQYSLNLPADNDTAPCRRLTLNQRIVGATANPDSKFIRYGVRCRPFANIIKLCPDETFAPNHS